MPESHTPLVTFSSILEQEKSGFLGKKTLAQIFITLVQVCITAKCNNNAKSNANRKCNKL